MITKVRVVPVENSGTRVVAVAELIIEDQFVIHDVRVINGRDGIFVAMPSRLGNDGIFRDIVHPISREARERLNDAVLGEYRRTLGKVSCAG